MPKPTTGHAQRQHQLQRRRQSSSIQSLFFGLSCPVHARTFLHSFCIFHALKCVFLAQSTMQFQRPNCGNYHGCRRFQAFHCHHQPQSRSTNTMSLSTLSCNGSPQTRTSSVLQPSPAFRHLMLKNFSAPFMSRKASPKKRNKWWLRQVSLWRNSGVERCLWHTSRSTTGTTSVSLECLPRGPDEPDQPQSQPQSQHSPTTLEPFVSR